MPLTTVQIKSMEGRPMLPFHAKSGPVQLGQGKAKGHSPCAPTPGLAPVWGTIDNECQ